MAAGQNQVEVIKVGSQDGSDPLTLAASMLRGSIQNGQLEGMFKDMVVSSVGQVVEPLLQSVKAAVGKMEEGQSKVESELKRQAKKHKQDISGIRNEQAETLALVRRMAQAAGVPLGGDKTRVSNKASRKREESISEDDEEEDGNDDEEMQDSSEDEEPDGWPNMKSANRTAAKPKRREQAPKQTPKKTKQRREDKRAAQGPAMRDGQAEVEGQGFGVLQALCKNLNAQDPELVGRLLAQTGMDDEKRVAFERELYRK